MYVLQFLVPFFSNVKSRKKRFNVVFYCTGTGTLFCSVLLKLRLGTSFHNSVLVSGETLLAIEAGHQEGGAGGCGTTPTCPALDPATQAREYRGGGTLPRHGIEQVQLNNAVDIVISNTVVAYKIFLC